MIMSDIVASAESVIQGISRDKKDNILLKTNQIRKILTAVNMLSNKIAVYQAKNRQTDTLLPEMAEEVKYLKVIIAYQAGRDKYVVKSFVEKAKLFERIDEIGTSIKKYNEFAKYMEALVAYHKFYGGKDS